MTGYEREVFEMLDRNGMVLGRAVKVRMPGERRFHLLWSLPFREGRRWFAGGRKLRRAALAAGGKPQLIINDLQPLPPNYTVHENTCVGYEFRDETGRVAVYHPKDDNSIRALVWEMYRGRISNEKCT